MQSTFPIQDPAGAPELLPKKWNPLESRQPSGRRKAILIDKLSVVITLVLDFIFLHEEFTTESIIGCVLIGAGTLLMVL